MNNLGSLPSTSSSKKPANTTVNPFARALAESEKGSYNKNKNTSNSNLNPFSEALARAGGQFPQQNSREPSLEEMLQQKQELESQRQKEALRKKLHDQVNPVDQQDIFNARRERTKKDLEDVRRELKSLATEISKFYKEVDVQTIQTVTNQGTEGVGLKTYFQKLKTFIILLTQKVRSTRTWMQQQQIKSQKKNRKIKGGLMIDGGGAQETKTVFDMMHHERSNAYGG